MQRKMPANYDVEVITADDFWAQFGPPPPDPHRSSTPSNTEFRYRRWGTRAAATLLTLAIHAALVGTAFLGSAGRPPHKPLNEGASASSQSDNATEFVSVMLLLNDHSITPPDQFPDDSAYATQTVPDLLAKDAVLLTSINKPKPHEISRSDGGTDESAPTAEAVGDEAGRAMLFGRYMGQIKARIERAWEYPATALSATFECKVLIRQNQNGEVQEVTLQRCGDDLAWQLSLVQAIQQASPLSAPPDESVFTDVMTLTLEGRKDTRAASIGAVAGD